MTLEIEASDTAAIDTESLAQTLTHVIKLRGAIPVVPLGSIPQNGAIIDRRTSWRSLP